MLTNRPGFNVFGTSDAGCNSRRCLERESLGKAAQADRSFIHVRPVQGLFFRALRGRPQNRPAKNGKRSMRRQHAIGRFASPAACLPVVWTLLVSAVIGFGPLGERGAAAATLYDPTVPVNNLPDQQGWHHGYFSPDFVVDATTGVSGGLLRMNSTADLDDYAGYFSYNPLNLAAPALPLSLDRTPGFTLTFRARIAAEDHSGNPNRGGFSFLVVTDNNTKALELAFHADRIFSYDSAFLPDQVAPRATDVMTRYDLTVVGDNWSLSADSAPILSGPLVDYTGFPGLLVPIINVLIDPYERPHTIFFGDDTTSAGADVFLGEIALEPVPEPASVVLVAGLALSAGLVLLNRTAKNRKRSKPGLRAIGRFAAPATAFAIVWNYFGRRRRGVQINSRVLARCLLVATALGLAEPLVASAADQPGGVESRATSAVADQKFTGPWNLAALKEPPKAEWGEKKGLVQQVYYQGEPWRGRPTRVFAYYGRPEEGQGPFPGNGPFPAMVLVHGGGGTAFAEWVELWVKRGYAALAMDLGGCGPDKQRLPDGGPAQDHPAKFRAFQSDEEARELWSYHAVAAVIRGHSLLCSRPEVDPRRIAVTGISWGGYLTCIVAGLDDRFRAAVPVYGCGFLTENSTWLGEFGKLGPEQTARWAAFYDPSRYLPQVRCPIFFVNGTNDFAYPPDSYKKSVEAVPGDKLVRIEVNMPHGHQQGWAPKEIGWFVDSVLLGGDPLAKLGPIETAGDTVRAAIESKVRVVSGQLHYTSDSGPWQKRKWQSVAAAVSQGRVEAPLPTARPLVYFLSVADERGATVSTIQAELPQPPQAKEANKVTQDLIRAIDSALAKRWDESHGIVQRYEDDATASWIHAVLHKIEGDMGNSRYWYRRAGKMECVDREPYAELGDIRKQLAGE